MADKRSAVSTEGEEATVAPASEPGPTSAASTPPPNETPGAAAIRAANTVVRGADAPNPAPAAPLPTAQEMLRPRVGDFRPGLDFVLGETLRRDPLGVTYRARDVQRGRDVAVTLYHPSATLQQEALDRFQDAILVAAVEHPAILSVERVGQWHAQAAVARRLVYAPTLAEALPRGTRCDLSRVLELLRPIASALDVVHGAGIVHGDIRPEAILLTRSAGPLLVGCGVAEGLNLSALLIATLERRSEWGAAWLEAAGPYLAPERWRGGKPDARSDQYALAVVAFRMLTGDLPFIAEHVAQLAELHRIAVVPRASSVRGELPPSVDVAITRALAKVAGERFTTTTSFIDALAGFPPRTRVVTDPAHVAKAREESATDDQPRHRPLMMAAAVVMTLVIVAAAVAAIVLR
jgi:serine/threonine protein kinase